MATIFQKHQHLDLFVQRVLRARNDLEFLKDRINFALGVPPAQELNRAKAIGLAMSVLDELIQPSRGIPIIMLHVETNMTPAQRAELSAAADVRYGAAEAQIVRDIYNGLKSIRPTLEAASTEADLAALPGLITAIPYVELGVGPV